VDHVAPEKRSLIMAAVRSKNTKPEMAVRRLVHGLGYRYRLHAKELPGHPDLAFPSRKKIVFVHGCFWHRHPRCRYATSPKTRVAFWNEKFEKNVARDRRDRRALKKAGWAVMIVWQCELKNLERLARRIDDFLKKDG
jgi:DNA mismatch endonuclease (patch repair protein)